MSQITMTIVDSRRAIHAQPHGGFIDRVVAALSADPETIEELEAALARFVEPGERGPLAGWRAGVCSEPFDAGIAIVDLAARLVVVESTYSSPGPEGEVQHDANEQVRDVWLSYHLADDWAFSDCLEGWQAMAESRKARRPAEPPLDARRVLYGEVCEFIVEECFAAGGRADRAASGPWTPPEGWLLHALSQRAKPDQAPTAEDAVAEIHARWLMTPREDLRGQSPRDVLLAKRDHVSWDLQDRGHQWSMLGRCPPGLSPQSTAFRFGGFGTHEVVLYYDLVRELIWACGTSLVEPKEGADFQTSEVSETSEVSAAKGEQIRRLRQIEDQWLNTPQWEDLGGRTPAAVIERERARLPMVVSAEEAIVDDDCPLCQMLAEQSGPVFWNLDGCNMDFDFAFSFHRTREEWEKEQRDYEEFSRRCDEREKQRQAGLLEDEAPWTDDAESPSIWSRSLVAPDAADQPVGLRLFGIGAHLAELGVDLRSSPDTAPLADSLNRHFGNLRSAAGDASAALIEPVVQCLSQELVTASEGRPDLAAKCAELESELRDFAARMLDEPHEDA